MVFAAIRLRALLSALVVVGLGAAAWALWVSRFPHGGARATPDPRQQVLQALQRILDERANTLVSFDERPLNAHYDLTSIHGRWALEHEQRRLRYVKAWAEKRNIRLVSAAVKYRIPTLKLKENEAWLSLVQSARLGYVYQGDPSQEKHLFGIGTRHYVQLVRRGNEWVVRRDWYTDPLDEDTLIPEVTPADVSESDGMLLALMQSQRQGWGRCSPAGVEDAAAAPGSEEGVDGPAAGLLQSARSTWDALLGWASGALGRQTPPPGPPAKWPDGEAQAASAGYSREAAVAYARRFCGAAWGCGNDGRYNPAYRDYTDIGGDCTNFTSQVLHAGGLPMTSVWYYRQGSGGSRAWVQTEGLLNYLLASGRGQLLARGHFADVVKPTDRFPTGAVQALEPGDVIGYQEKGRIVHLATVTGRDFRGYVVVNSHTADRNMVPWDVGWDRATIFWLIKIRG